MGRVHTDAKIAAPALIEATKRKGGTRTNAFGALGTFGPDAKAAVPALIQASKRRDLRRIAVDALSQIDNESKVQDIAD